MCIHSLDSICYQSWLSQWKIKRLVLVLTSVINRSMSSACPGETFHIMHSHKIQSSCSLPRQQHQETFTVLFLQHSAVKCSTKVWPDFLVSLTHVLKSFYTGYMWCKELLNSGGLCHIQSFWAVWWRGKVSKSWILNSIVSVHCLVVFHMRPDGH